MEKDSLSYKTLKNSTYTFINYAFPILFSVFITPIIVHRLGVEDFGVYVLINTIVGFLALMDLGLTTALIKLSAEYYAQKDFKKLERLVNSANSLFLIIGIISFLTFLVIGIFFLPYFNIAQGSNHHVLIVCLLAGVYMFFNSVNSVFTVLPAALQRFDVSTKVSLANLTFFNLASLVAVLLGYKLKVIWSLNAFSIIVTTFFLVWYFRNLLPEVHFGFSWDREEIKKSYKFGLLAAIANTANSFLTQLDRLVIPMYQNTAQLSYYSLPGNVAQKTAGLVGSVTGVFFPLASSMSGVGENEKIKSIYRRTLSVTTIFAAGCTMAMAVFSRQILSAWVGQEFADRGWKILIILAATYFFLSLYGVASNFLMGLNKIKFLAGVSVLLALVNLGLLFLLLPRYGIVGAAWAYFGAAALVPFIIFYSEIKFYGLKGLWSFYLKLYGKLLVTSVVFYFFISLLVRPWVNSFAEIVVIGPLSLAFFFFLHYLFRFYDKEDVDLFKRFFGVVRQRLKF